MCGERIVAAPGVRVPEERGGGDGDVSGAVEGDTVDGARAVWSAVAVRAFVEVAINARPPWCCSIRALVPRCQCHRGWRWR